MCAGTQGGKTGFGPWWLKREIDQQGLGDYQAVTATFDLFKLKMLPALLHVFRDILDIGRYWAGDRLIELRDPETGRFWAERSTDAMWGRIILRSADSPGGLESGTVKAAWLDEAGQPRFTVGAWRSIRRRLALHQGRVLVTTTLYDLGWVKATFIDKAEDGGVKQLATVRNEAEVEQTDNAQADICLIQFDSIANPTYPLTEYVDARENMPDDEFQMFWRGRATRLRYLVYDAFDPDGHTCPRFPISGDWKRYIGLDFGDVHTAAVFYAEEPETRQLYCYREYLTGGRTAKEHAEAILEGEPGLPAMCVGGSKSEGQWRREFAAGGLPIKPPLISDVGVGINRVYGCHKRGEIIYFDDLVGMLGEKASYKKKRDREGNVIDEIDNKGAFHRLDAERYIIGRIRGDYKREQPSDVPTSAPRGARRAVVEQEKESQQEADGPIRQPRIVKRIRMR